MEKLEIINLIGLAVSALTIIGFVYGFLRNFKSDINEKFSGMEKRLNAQDKHLAIQDERIEKQNMRLDGIYTVLLNNSKK